MASIATAQTSLDFLSQRGAYGQGHILCKIPTLDKLSAFESVGRLFGEAAKSPVDPDPKKGVCLKWVVPFLVKKKVR